MEKYNVVIIILLLLLCVPAIAEDFDCEKECCFKDVWTRSAENCESEFENGVTSIYCDSICLEVCERANELFKKIEEKESKDE